jgi:hypothetical protein
VRLVQTTGSHHLQIYWVAAGAGRTLETFPLLWLRGEDRWLPRLAVFIAPPTEQYTVPGVWNYTCIGCHTTHPRPQLTFGPEPRADSSVTEFGIACEACHGSGAAHAAAYRSPLDRYLAHFGFDGDPQIVDPSRLTHRRSAQVCGQCHSVRTFYSQAHAREWSKRGFSFRPGDDLDEAVSIISNATLDRPYTQRIAKAFRSSSRAASGTTESCAWSGASTTHCSSRAASSAARCRASRVTSCTRRQTIRASARPGRTISCRSAWTTIARVRNATSRSLTHSAPPRTHTTSPARPAARA